MASAIKHRGFTQLSPYPSSNLTAMEKRVVNGILDCLSNKQIAIHLGNSEDTIKRHLSNIFNKTGCDTRLECYRKFCPMSDEAPFRAEIDRITTTMGAEIKRLNAHISTLEDLIFRGMRSDSWPLVPQKPLHHAAVHDQLP